MFQIPANIVLKRTSPKFWLPTLSLAWGVVATLLGVVQNRSGFYAARFFLGVAESGLFPGVVFYLSMWYKRNERQYRISLFFSAASLAGSFGGILAYGIAYMKGVGGLNGWRWIFILEGLLTVVVSISAYYFIAQYPSKAKFLNECERSLIHARLKADSDSSRDEAFHWSNVAQALKDYKCWLYCLAFHTMSLPLYTLSLFLPTIIQELGYKAATAQLLTIPPYALATILTVIVAVVSERSGKRAPFAIASSCFAMIGYIILLANTHPTRRPGLSYAGTFFAAAGIYPATALALSWTAVNASGQTKRATANAMQISIGNLGAVLGTQLYRSTGKPAYANGPRFLLGHGMALAYLVGNVVVVSTLWYCLNRENRKRDLVERQEPERMTSEGDEWKGDDDLRWRFKT